MKKNIRSKFENDITAARINGRTGLEIRDLTSLKKSGKSRLQFNKGRGLRLSCDNQLHEHSLGIVV